MADGARYSRALILGASVVSIASLMTESGVAQTADQAAQSVKPVQPPKQAKRNPAKPQANQPQAGASVWDARAQAIVGVQSLDTITAAASKTDERAVDALAPVSVVTSAQIEARQASTVGDLIYNVPGVWVQNRGDEPSTSINIRGLQDFGRVAVIVDGARQNYQRTGHFANGSFFLNPELISGIDIVRGPTANIYGSGAIGGVASFRTKDIEDVVRAGERWGVDVKTILGSNYGRALGSAFGGVHVNPNVDVFAGGTYSTQENYKDGTGFEVANTGNRLTSGIAKLTVRPADGHEVKLGTIFQEDIYSVGQPPRRAGDPNSTNANGTNNLSGTSIYASNVKNYTTTLGWKYSQPDDQWFDWDAKVYWNRTENDQIKTAHTSTTPSVFCGGVPGNAVSGCIGSNRGYLLDTIGVDVHNTTRFETGSWRHAVTYGLDAFQDKVSTQDRTGTSEVTTPGGKRTVSGGFVQWKADYTSMLEVIGALRYDNYQLSSASASSGGDRLSPKITVALVPTAFVTPYASYAEGYRAPSITETLVSGPHSGATINDSFFRCPSGTPGPGADSTFCFVPNPNLRPEVGKNKEIGFNIKKNDLFTAGDTLRGKINFFRNDITDFIDQVAYGNPLVVPTGPPPAPSITVLPFLQYQNVASARIQGFEAETMYDANTWFFGLSGTYQNGKNLQTGFGLYSIPPQKITTTAGVRLLDRTLILSVMWTSAIANYDIPRTYTPATSFDLVNFYAQYQPRPDLTLNFSVENLLNQYYRPYAIPVGSTGDTQNDVKWASAGAGLVVKGGLKYHFGGI
ncbi:TonB-dependent hemoglobin/transferrin/lactoferrin family receptor [Bradyrhizobium cajani]|uniref:TonB-dependent hemoglobin/transferrin/lactoferrin family receptor n=1 Tax=Bradyrhizobium cajani TaxID=1928661 RepID=A0A844TDY4_9BRAD|nr:TonB-dependent hemoglobin/transferrin/lactoferrin family receptor [Bradyrhizobium cajani]MCP3367483.1 TonB-dependent hemoglobin/transferrin/lactoferrin family receptor [Bradyrhizobium cajani]MVT77258.1 TonB-dependent hemoglobin/transferrin/lactoferrin family receptor [Bradyrhizobium cajani]